jgi:hypothetical protein
MPNEALSFFSLLPYVETVHRAGAVNHFTKLLVYITRHAMLHI